jgi:ketosteroid isomerase-like protein
MPYRNLTLVAALGALIPACQPGVDVALETEPLLEADRAWAAIAAANDNLDSIVSFWTDDARVVMSDQPAWVGKAAIREMVAGTMAIPGFRVSWTPETAVVAASGDLGYTFGTNAFTAPDSTGQLVTSTGRYLTVWRKGTDGRWRCAVDFGNPGPAGGAAP